jgi:HK97 family phage portal protein
MGFLDIFRREKRSSTTANPAGLFSAAWQVLSQTQDTVSGEPINDTIALSHITVYVCVRVIAEAIGSMTCRTYKRLPKGRKEATDDPLHRMLSIEPNSDMSAPVMWESVAGAMALTGHAYAEILRNKAGDPVGLYPLDPRMTEPVRLPNKKLAYKTRVGMPNGEARIINAEDCLSFPLFSLDGLRGLSPISQARNAVALSIATEKGGARYFGNNSVPPAILTPVGDVSAEDAANMREYWEAANAAGNQGRIGVLPSDWKLTQLSMSPEDSQFLETRQFNRTDIAALFCMSPSRVGDVTKQSKASAEQENLSFVTDTLRPYLVRIETEIQRKLLPKNGSMFIEFDVSERLRGDFGTTMQGFAVGKQWGFYSTNVVLEKLGENPIGDAGDIYWAPVNMTNAANLLAPAADPSPEPLIDPPTGAADPQQRDLFGPYLPMMTRMFQDAVGRAVQRSKKDAETLSPIFSPIMDSLISVVTVEARKQFSLPDDWQPSEKIAKDYFRSAASRSATWTEENRDQAASQELYKATQAAHLNVFREAGAALALKGTTTHE